MRWDQIRGSQIAALENTSPTQNTAGRLNNNSDDPPEEDFFFSNWNQA